MPLHRGRRSLRLPARDYSEEGACFVTTCTFDRLALFGEIVEDAMCLNEFGSIVAEKWLWLPSQYPYVTLDEWCVMPDHLHAILVLAPHHDGACDTTTDGVTGATPVADRAAAGRRKTVGRLIGAFKTVTTKQVNRVRGTPGGLLWQRDFWERVVRDEVEMNAIRQYIRQNPVRYTAARRASV